VRGVLPDAAVTVVNVEWHGSDALTTDQQAHWGRWPFSRPYPGETIDPPASGAATQANLPEAPPGDAATGRLPRGRPAAETRRQSKDKSDTAAERICGDRGGGEKAGEGVRKAIFHLRRTVACDPLAAERPLVGQQGLHS
jgi:hypothetical protein